MRLATAALTGLLAIGAPAAAGAAGAEAGQSVTVRPDPTYRGGAFEGWGTSLAWFANATGDYPGPIRERLAELVFGESGLDLNIARYNIGGGNAPDVPDYLRPGGAVEGWWRAPEGTTRADRDWWDPDNPEHWNLAADATQRWWVDRVKGDVTRWETFSNSPPWFQTNSGYVSGNFDASQDQIRTGTLDDFAAYLVGVTAELERAHGIRVDSIDPLNEPNTDYWGTRLGADGNPVGGRQEGAHAGPALQADLLRALRKRLGSGQISAMDETNPGTFATDWNAYPQDVQDAVGRLNVHTYGTGRRTTVRDIAKGERKPLWMSEVEGSWGDGQSFTSMAPGLGMAQHIVDDLRELEPDAYVFWQPVEDYDNMAPGGESAAGANWGSIQLPFDCTATDTLDTCPIHTNTKFDTIRNFTHYLRPGDHLIKVNDTDSTAAVSGADTATVVHVNDTTATRTVRLDLSAFARVAPGATVTPIVTDAGGALQRHTPIRVRNASATIDVGPESVTTFLIRGVHGASRAAAAGAGQVQLEGVQSGKYLNGTVITTTPGSPWKLTPLSRGFGNRDRYTLTSGGQRLSALAPPGSEGDGVTLLPATGRPSTAEQWMLSTTGDGTYTLINAATTRVLDVPGQATADGSPVSTWAPNSGANQLWRAVPVGTNP